MVEERSLVMVIDQVAGLLPAGEYEELRSALGSLRESVRYTAPELLPMRWRQVGESLEDHLPAPSGDAPVWVRSIADVFAGRGAS